MVSVQGLKGNGAGRQKTGVKSSGRPLTERPLQDRAHVERGTWNALTESQRSARIADTYSSRRGGRADLTRRATETDAGVLMQYAEEVEGSATPSGWIISAHAVE